MSLISELSAIDTHGHYGQCKVAGNRPLKEKFTSGSPELVVKRARMANTEWTVVSPLLGLLPRGNVDAVAGNEEAHRVVRETDGLLQWVVVNPLQPETFKQAERMLTSPKCVGMKIHPEEHCYPIIEYGRMLFEFAERFSAVILTHSGEPNSMPDDYVPFADEFPQVTLILAHLGSSGAKADTYGLQVEAIQASKHGNMMADTSSAQSITPGLIEWGVGEVGADHILYGTDTPLYFAPSQRARINFADLTDNEKSMILRSNAERILPFFQ